VEDLCRILPSHEVGYGDEDLGQEAEHKVDPYHWAFGRNDHRQQEGEEHSLDKQDLEGEGIALCSRQEEGGIAHGRQQEDPYGSLHIHELEHHQEVRSPGNLEVKEVYDNLWPQEVEDNHSDCP